MELARPRAIGTPPSFPPFPPFTAITCCTESEAQSIDIGIMLCHCQCCSILRLCLAGDYLLLLLLLLLLLPTRCMGMTGGACSGRVLALNFHHI